ncbi:MAG: hypothetical protein R3B57_02715 [Phycisphaerales bacterium]
MKFVGPGVVHEGWTGYGESEAAKARQTLPARPRSMLAFKVDRWTHGWPVPALRRESRSVTDFVSLNYTDESRPIRAGLGTPWKDGWRQQVRLELVPVWPGFAIDAAFYAGVCWVLLFAPGVAIRWRRRQRGRCPACGYDLAGLESCPECGGAA